MDTMIALPRTNPVEHVDAWLTSQEKSGVNRIDYLVMDDGNGPHIVRWDDNTLGPPPTALQLAALTAQANEIAVARQIKAKLAQVDPTLSAGLAELVAVLLTKGALSRTDLSANLLSAVNARRSLLGLSAL